MRDERHEQQIPEPPRGRNPQGGSFFSAQFIRVIFIGASLLLLVIPSSAQGTNSTATQKTNLRQHFDAAQDFQSSGKLENAAEEYRLFLADALGKLASNRSQIGDFGKAVQLFEKALNLAPANVDLRIDYADACRMAKDLVKAQALAQAAVDAAPQNARAHVVLGRVLLQVNDPKAATEQMEAAVAIESNFANGSALASAYLKSKDEPHATQVFHEMLASYGDSVDLHMNFGTAYAQAGYPDQAIQEFKKVIALNGKYPGAHYSLGAAYVLGLGEAGYSEAIPEFREELKINPDDYNSQFQLGFIDLNQHRLPEAETELTRAATLAPTNPDAFLSLGQLYQELNRPADAEAALRKTIAITKDVTRNHYQVQRAHYLLARLLLQSGRQDEGKQEMQVSEVLSKKSVLQNQGKSAGAAVSDEVAANAWKDAPKSEDMDPQALKQVEAYEAQIAPAIADSYDNLGVIAAGGNDFAGAVGDFEAASEWNPNIEGLDYNLGRAAFSANQYEHAVGPLGRYLEAHPDDTLARSELGLSLFRIRNYADALETLKPMQGLVDADPNVAFAYSVCLVKAGDYAQGLDRLKGLGTENPNAPAIHEALGEALVRHGDFAAAATELRIAVKLNPAGIYAKYNLALALIGLEQKEEARQLLSEVVAKSPQIADAYYRLGKLQLEHGDAKAAIATLEAGAAKNPGNAPIHFQLAAAYRKDSRIQDSEREAKVYETLRDEESKAHDTPKQN
jgi:tetratricopeptide (TPR) repeat protein